MRLWAAATDGDGKNNNNDDDDDDLISEMDARVLQSMLRDNKLDLEQSSNMKKLLERGVRKDKDDDEDDEQEKKKKDKNDDDDDGYSSQVLKTLANTKFWKAFKRNAGEALESLTISVTNEIEKSAKVLVGLGFIAWDRAKQDVARALPSASTKPKPRQVFQLGETSSYVDQEQPTAEEQEAATRAQRAKSLRQEFTTPADEISAVTDEISSIFKRANRQVAQKEQARDKSKDTRNPFFAAFVEEQTVRGSGSNDGAETTAAYTGSTLSTTASRGNARLQSAFKKTQKTKLAQQKENPASRANRLASAAIDSAYQVQKEIQSEENVPGYKTKELRESTVDVSRRIAGAAKKTAGFLGGASAFLLGGNGKADAQEQQQLPSATSYGANANADADGAAKKAVEANPVDFLDDSAYFAYQRGGPQDQEGNEYEYDNTNIPNIPSIEEEDLSAGVVIEDGNIATDTPEKGSGGAFGFFNAITNRGRGRGPTNQDGDKESTADNDDGVVRVPPSFQQGAEFIDSEFVMANKDNFNYFDAETVSSNTERFTTDSYLDNMDDAETMEVEATASTSMPATGRVTASDDDGLRQVTAEIVSDDDFDDSVFEKATAVDNISVEELLEQQAAREAAENKEPNFVTRATLRTLDVAFLVVEKGVSVAPGALEVAMRAVTRATEAKLKGSAGSKVGWESHNGNVRGEKRY